MPPRRNKEKFQQLTEDYRPSRRRIFLTRNGSSCAAEQFHSGASLETVDQQAPKNCQWMTEGNVSARQSIHTPYDRTASSRQLATRWSTATGALMLVSSIRRHLLHRGLRAKLEVVPFLKGIPGAIFQQDDARPHVAKTLRDFCSAQHMQLLPGPAYSTEYVWDLAGQRLAHDSGPGTSRTSFCCAYKQYGIFFHKQTFKSRLDSLPLCIAALIAARGGYTKY
ncbi:transposable element Tcb2 transposase [Trichonephila clavipes]|nr:transposable element Tcb2 transposase [Trichonephila clavipes]